MDLKEALTSPKFRKKLNEGRIYFLWKFYLEKSHITTSVHKINVLLKQANLTL